MVNLLAGGVSGGVIVPRPFLDERGVSPGDAGGEGEVYGRWAKATNPRHTTDMRKVAKVAWEAGEVV